MNDFPEYCKIMALGKLGTEDIFEDEVVISEKCDGSSVRIMNDGGTIRVGSHKKEISLEGSTPDAKMFIPFTTWVKENETALLSFLPNQNVIFGEMCQSHNVIKYANKYPIVIFDIGEVAEYGLEFRDANFQNIRQSYLSKELKVPIAPTLYRGKVTNRDQLDKFLSAASFLDKTKNIEGIVIKNYSRLNQWDRHLFAKLVRQEFKERNKEVFKRGESKSVEEAIAEFYFTRARLIKMVQRLKEEGKYTGELKDIQYLVGMIPKDIEEEHKEDIKEFLYQHFWKQINRIISARIAPEYKKYVQEELFRGMDDEHKDSQ